MPAFLTIEPHAGRWTVLDTLTGVRYTPTRPGLDAARELALDLERQYTEDL